jgi:hypothetical protein
MLINSLETMEAIVENDDTLSWDGWNVVQLISSPTGWTKPNGAFVNGQWFAKTVYSITEVGWNISSKLVKKYAE